MAYDRPSWREIDKMKDRPSRKKKRQGGKKELEQHSTRYDKYKADLNRLFDQGLAGELLKEPPKEPKELVPEKPAPKPKAKTAVATRKAEGRVAKGRSASASRLKLIRAVIDAEDQAALNQAVHELTDRFGLPDDWEVLVRVLEYNDEKVVLQAVGRMSALLPVTAKIPRRFTLKERLRSIGQTASDADLRAKATELEERL